MWNNPGPSALQHTLRIPASQQARQPLWKNLRRLALRHTLKTTLLLFIVATLVPACATPSARPSVALPVTLSPDPAAPVLMRPPLRLLLVDSYSATDTWAGQSQSTQIRTGILETLQQQGYGAQDAGADVFVYEEFFMDLGRNIEPGEQQAVIQEAIAAIDAFNPDVVVVLKDDAARELIPVYPDPNQPFVFCGLSGDLVTYRLNRPNVTGVLEKTKPLQTVRMAESFVREAESFLILGDASSGGLVSAAGVYREILGDDDLQLSAQLRTTNRWETWQRLVLQDAADVDFLLLLQPVGLRNAAGALIPEQFALRWTLQHAPVPVFSLWLDAVQNGAVGGLVVSNYDQGVQAAQIVLRILEGTHPSSILVTSPDRNTLALNLAAADYWELQIPLKFLTVAQIYTGPGPTRRQ